MKKILLLLAVFIYSFSASFGQNSLTLHYGSDHYVAPKDYLFEHFVTVVNSGSNTVQVKVMRSVLNLASGHSTQFCWGTTCNGFTTDLGSDTVTILPGDSSLSFIAKVNPATILGQDDVQYSFFNINNVSDSTNITFHYDFTTGIINNPSSIKNSLNFVLHDATNNLITVNYTLNGDARNPQIVFYNLLGTPVKTISLTDKSGILIIPSVDLSNGIYVCGLNVGGKTFSTRKLMISHH